MLRISAQGTTIQTEISTDIEYQWMFTQSVECNVPGEFQAAISDDKNNWIDLGLHTLQNNSDIQYFKLSEAKSAHYINHLTVWIFNP